VSRLTDVRDTAKCHPYLMDGLIALSVYVVTLVGPHFAHRSELGPVTTSTVVLGAVVSGALVFRRQWPRLVLLVTTVGVAGYLALGGLRSPLMLATMIAVYTLALVSSRRDTVIIGVVTAMILADAGVLFGDHSWLGPEILGLIAQIGLATAVGEAARNRRAYIAAIEERAHRAEQTREEEAARRVIEERLRIARELHDVLGHHIALINVQAGVAGITMETDPVQAREALAHIRKAGRSALEELRTTVGLLRQPNAPDEPPTEPAPGLDRLPELVASFAASGLPIAQEMIGEQRELTATVDLTAYRVVQEALTNVSKHAGGAPATLRITYTPDELQLEVTDAGKACALGDGTGHGLLGMRERALSVGGTFSAGPRPEGGFRVRTVLPA
jgi:signal transduction histidine kinase